MPGVLSDIGRRVVHSRGGRLARQFDRQILDCERAQRQTLQRLLTLNAGTRFQVDYTLAPGLSVDAFRQRVPLSTWDQFAPYADDLARGRAEALCGRRNRPLMLALSSGTTGATKQVPVTTAFLKDYRRGWMVWAWHAFEAHPDASRGKFFQVISNHHQFSSPGGLPCGNISGLVQTMQSRLVRKKFAVPAPVTRVEAPADKRYLTLRLALTEPDVTLISTANPSTLIQLARQADQQKESLLRDIHDGTLSTDCHVPAHVRTALLRRLARPDPAGARHLEKLAEQDGRLRPAHYWPHAALIAVWTGGSAGAYLPQLRNWYGNLPIRDHGLSASEGRMTIPIADHTSTGLLDVTSHFYEFIPAAESDNPEAQTLLAHQLTEGEDYHIVLTTASGLYRYNISDVVRCHGFHGTTPLLEFLHKGAHISNLTGEKLTESQVVAAVTAASRQTGSSLSHYTLCPRWGDPPGYQLLVETTDLQPGTISRELSREATPSAKATVSPPAVPEQPGGLSCETDHLPDSTIARTLATAVDAHLQEINCEYHDKRTSGRLAPVALHPLPPGTWTRYITRHHQSHTGASPEQYKHPCLKPDLDFADQFCS